jgi:hypothetical protein
METLSWLLVEPRLLAGGPWALSMGGSRGVQFGRDTLDERLFVRLPAQTGETAPTTSFADLRVEVRLVDAKYFLEVSTAAGRIFREFHRFATLVTEAYERADATASEAFLTAIEGWQELVAEKNILTPDQQTGLMGELLLLRALVELHGLDAHESWIGRDPALPARHDFRIGSIDLEVKTTRSTLRRHFIHGMSQLVAAEGHALYILSIRLEAAGARSGLSLADLVHLLREELGQGKFRQRFEQRLRASQYNDADSHHYQEPVIVADSPRLVPVNDICPRITPQVLESELGLTVLSRIDDVTYRIDVEGMGCKQASYEFMKALGPLEIRI